MFLAGFPASTAAGSSAYPVAVAAAAAAAVMQVNSMVRMGSPAARYHFDTRYRPVRPDNRADC